MMVWLAFAGRKKTLELWAVFTGIMRAYCIHRGKHEDGVGAKFSTAERNQACCSITEDEITEDDVKDFTPRRLTRLDWKLKIFSKPYGYYGYCTQSTNKSERLRFRLLTRPLTSHLTHEITNSRDKVWGRKREASSPRFKSTGRLWLTWFRKGIRHNQESQQAKNKNKKTAFTTNNVCVRHAPS